MKNLTFKQIKESIKELGLLEIFKLINEINKELEKRSKKLKFYSN